MENMENTEIFAVMDTETNWCNEVMSIGVAIANCETFELIDTRYYILNPEYLIGGMFLCSVADKRQSACHRM